MLRITGGRFRGRKLAPLAGRDVRPSPSRLRQAVFDILHEVEDLRVLDLFCGAGTFGFEALSRGATSVTFVDRSPRSLSIVRRNADLLGATESVRLLHADALKPSPRVLEALAEPFDLAYLDPPFAMFGVPEDRRALANLLERIASADVGPAPGRIGIEHPSRKDPPDAPTGFEAAEPRRFGDCAVTLFQRAPASAQPGPATPSGP